MSGELNGDGRRDLVFLETGKAYVDLNTSNGASLLGHGHPAVRKAIEQALDMGIVCVLMGVSST